jgi:hypothetical protein|uniref:Uncharacterized protein n=1 Tax=Sipha flava TaxID=143950 RepID=A0A2S2QLT3_9HEMI
MYLHASRTRTTTLSRLNLDVLSERSYTPISHLRTNALITTCLLIPVIINYISKLFVTYNRNQDHAHVYVTRFYVMNSKLYFMFFFKYSCLLFKYFGFVYIETIVQL